MVQLVRPAAGDLGCLGQVVRQTSHLDEVGESARLSGLGRFALPYGSAGIEGPPVNRGEGGLPFLGGGGP